MDGRSRRLLRAIFETSFVATRLVYVQAGGVPGLKVLGCYHTVPTGPEAFGHSAIPRRFTRDQWRSEAAPFPDGI